MNLNIFIFIDTQTVFSLANDNLFKNVPNTFYRDSVNFWQIFFSLWCDMIL